MLQSDWADGALQPMMVIEIEMKRHVYVEPLFRIILSLQYIPPSSLHF